MLIEEWICASGLIPLLYVADVDPGHHTKCGLCCNSPPSGESSEVGPRHSKTERSPHVLELWAELNFCASAIPHYSQRTSQGRGEVARRIRGRKVSYG